MQGLQVFNYSNKEVRTVTKNAEPWFVAKDVCDILEISDTWNAVNRLSNSMKGTDIISTLGGNQEMTVISEAGLYKLVFTSRKPEAEKFTDWVASEVIPSIRKHGAYMTPETIEKAIMNPDFVINLATKLKEEQTKRSEAEAIIEEQKPKVLFADAVSCSSSTILIGDLAKLIKQNGVDIGQKRLFAWLRENGYLIKRHGADYNSPTQMAMDLKLFTIKETAITHSDGHVTVSKTTKVTGKGQTYFVNKFLGKKTA
jgi:anti-repressor protein